MSKIIKWDIPLGEAYYCVAVHWGDFGTDPHTALHCVYYYFGLDLPAGVTAYHQVPSLELAHAEALAWLTLPHLVTEICLACRDYGPGWLLPRWGSLGHEHRFPAPTAILWDVLQGPPPWQPS